MSVRIGIDVGGTFTDAVIIDDETFELIGSVKIPTTHDDPQGVASGIIKALNLVLKKYDISPEDVTFIAHGTTQATNSLLEGDVEKVGVIGLGKGLEGIKVKSDTKIDNIELAPGKFLYTDHSYIDISSDWRSTAESTLKNFKDKGINVVVASAAYSVDDPSDEIKIKNMADEYSMISTCSHEISKLYGLKVRTRTAVINASILPKMLQTADMTQESVKSSNIKAPLMIMRCDGGVMSIQEVKKRPILTMLSGPAAGVAGALMYEKISEGIFLEVGGTSTDISVIHNGHVMVSYAEVGGHKTYVHSLDVRTVGVAGGSMIRASESDIVDVGPRSAHIAGLPYLVYSNPDEVSDDLEICFIEPKPGDLSDYIAIIDKKTGRKYALTLACAANASGYIKEEDYACGNSNLALKGFSVLAKKLGKPVDGVLAAIHSKAAAKNKAVISQLMLDYNLDPMQIVLVGGGGGASVVVPYLAGELGLKYRIAKNAEVISPIGVALAMVRDVVERTIPRPTDKDILRVRREAEQAALKAGASQGTIGITVEVDTKRNIVRATATGAIELRTKERTPAARTAEEIIDIAANSITPTPRNVIIKAETDGLYICTAAIKKRAFLKLFSSSIFPVRVLDREGIIRLQKSNARVVTSNIESCAKVLKSNINELTQYGDGGERIPECYVLVDAKILDFSNLMNSEQIISLLNIELSGFDKDKNAVIILCNNKV